MAVVLRRRLQGFVVLTVVVTLALSYLLPDRSLSSRVVKQKTQDMTELLQRRGRDPSSDAMSTSTSARRDVSDDSGQTKRTRTYTSDVISNGTTSAKTSVCDRECQKLSALFRTWPSDRPKAAFYYLTKASRLSLLIESLASVDKHFNDRFRYPIVIFHERDLTEHIDYIREHTRSVLIFQLVHFSVPDFLSRPIPRSIPCISQVSYRHMCRFHAKTVYEEPTMTQLDYYWRLDDDSLLLSNVNYDVFLYMRSHSIEYGYLWRHWDSLVCVTGLWEATEKYIEEHRLKTEFFSSWKKGYLYYNNFEVSSTRLWLSDKYKSYIDYIDRLGGIFYYRWGDAPLHGIAVSMFIPKNQTHLFADIRYKHGSYVHEVYNSTSRPHGN